MNYSGFVCIKEGWFAHQMLAIHNIDEGSSHVNNKFHTLMYGDIILFNYH